MVRNATRIFSFLAALPLLTSCSHAQPITPQPSPGDTKAPLAGAQSIVAEQGMNWNEFKSALMKRYDLSLAELGPIPLVSSER